MSENRTVKIYLDESDLNKKLEQANQKYEKLVLKMKGMKEGSAAHAKAAAEVQNLERRTEQYRQQLAGKMGPTLNQLYAEQRKLNAALAEMPLEMRKISAESKRLEAVRTAIHGVKMEAMQLNQAKFSLRNSFDKFANNVNKYSAAFLGIGASIAGITMAIKGGIKAIGEYEDQLADISKTTGLTIEQTKELAKELNKINTRTSNKELRELAREAGKLGIEGKENILEFVRAADKINIALGEDLGKGALTEIGKLADIFGIKDQLGIEQAMIRIGSAINEIGAASTATEGYLVDFSKRMSGVSGIANVSATEIIALAGTLDSLGQTSEVSSTAIANILLKMGENLSEFARIAKMSEGDFRKLMAEGGLKALLKVLEEIGKDGGSVEILGKHFKDMGTEGSRAVGVLGTLSANIDEVKRQTELANKAFLEGNSIQSEVDKKMATTAARVAQLEKAWHRLTTSDFVQSFFQGIVKGAEKAVDAMTLLGAYLNGGASGYSSALGQMAANKSSGDWLAKERAGMANHSTKELYDEFLRQQQWELEYIEDAREAINKGDIIDANKLLKEAAKVKEYKLLILEALKARAALTTGSNKSSKPDDTGSNVSGSKSGGASKSGFKLEPVTPINNLGLIEQEVSYYNASLNLRKWYDLNISEMQEEQGKKMSEIQARQAEMRLQAEFDTMMAVMNMSAEAVNFLGLVAGGSADSQKAFALFDIGIKTGAAIANSVAGATAAAAAAGPGAPFVLGPYIATMIGTVFTAMAQAHNVLNRANRPEAPNFQATLSGFASGGFTPSAPDDMKPVGIVHANEYVINARQLRQPWVMDFARLLEANRARGFATGGFTSPSSTSNISNVTNNINQGVSMDMMERMVSVMERLEQRVQEPLKSYTIIGNKNADEIRSLMVENDSNRMDLSV